MKKMKTNLLLSLAILSLLATSCSEQMYAYRKTVKTNQQAIARAEAKEQNAAKPAEVVPSEAAPAVVAAPAAVSEKATFEKTGRVVTAQSKNTVTNRVSNIVASKAAVSKTVGEAKQFLSKTSKVSKPTAADVGPKQLIILGLIILLIGIVVGIVAGWAGWLLTTVGAILIIVGLILYLVNYL